LNPLWLYELCTRVPCRPPRSRGHQKMAISAAPNTASDLAKVVRQQT
jgi:hypothetical protein